LAHTQNVHTENRLSSTECSNTHKMLALVSILKIGITSIALNRSQCIFNLYSKDHAVFYIVVKCCVYMSKVISLC